MKLKGKLSIHLMSTSPCAAGYCAEPSLSIFIILPLIKGLTFPTSHLSHSIEKFRSALRDKLVEGRQTECLSTFNSSEAPAVQASASNAELQRGCIP